MENLPIAVLSLAAGGFLAALVPIAIRKQHGTAFEKTFTGMFVAGGACVMLGLGGLVIASGADAPAATTWLGTLALIGEGIFLLAVLAGMMQTIWRRMAAKQR